MKWLALLAALACAPAIADEALWKKVQAGGQVLFIRHALTTPGVGDPPGFKLEDCSTQRNLAEEGRAEARRLGAELKRRKVPVGEVLSSPWCRCIETARLSVGEPKVWQPLSNLFGRQEAAKAQVEAMRARIATYRGKGNLLLFSHGSTAVALSGVSPATAEIIVLTPQGDGFSVAGRLPVPGGN